jgi:type VI secretion system protein VasD
MLDRRAHAMTRLRQGYGLLRQGYAGQGRLAAFAAACAAATAAIAGAALAAEAAAPALAAEALAQAAAPKAADGFSIETTLVGGPNLNPNLEGRASPVVVRLFELKRTAAFEAASFSALFDRPKEALGDDLISQEEFVLRPGEIRHHDRSGAPSAAALGLAAAFRTLEGDSWRLSVPVAAGAHNLLLIDFDHHRIQAPFQPGQSSEH